MHQKKERKNQMDAVKALWIRHAVVPLLTNTMPCGVETCLVKWPVPPMGVPDGFSALCTDAV